MQLDTLEEIEALTYLAAYRLGAERLELEFHWLDSYTSLGDATGFSRCLKGCIRISKPLWSLASFDLRVQTIGHELCHIITFAAFPRDAQLHPHGGQWAKLMEELDLPTNEYHNLDPSPLLMPGGALGNCSCAAQGKPPLLLTPRDVHLQKVFGASFQCPTCGEDLIIVKKGPPLPKYRSDTELAVALHETIDSVYKTTGMDLVAW